jgi:Heterokaryon incompatibility protein (HET)
MTSVGDDFQHEAPTFLGIHSEEIAEQNISSSVSLPTESVSTINTLAGLSPLEIDLGESPTITLLSEYESLYDISFKPQSKLHRTLPLPRDSDTAIRLLRLEKPQDPHDTIIRCTLYVADLRDEPEFKAVSYVWGKYSSLKDTIICNGQRYEVTKNCYKMLWRLRNIFGAITIWVDAICISQNDESERTIQIPLMRRIYPSAQRVYIWLGEGNEDTDGAMGFLARGGLPTKDPIPFESCKEEYQSWSWQIWLGWCLFTRSIPFRDIPHKTGLDDVLSGDWISRLWVLQELVLSDNPLFICGKESASWTAITHALKYMDIVSIRNPTLSFPQSRQRWLRQHAIWSEFRDRPLERVPDTAENLSSAGKKKKKKEKKDPTYVDYIHASLFICNVLKILAVLSAQLLVGGIFISWVIPVIQDHTASKSAILSLITNLILIYYLVFSKSKQSGSAVLQLSAQDALLTEIMDRTPEVAKDRYFAVLGIIETPKCRRPLVKESDTLPRIWTELSIRLIYWAGSLDILLVESDHSLSGSQSWVVDWATANSSLLLSQYCDFQRDNTLKIEKYCKAVHATSRSFPHFYLDSEYGLTVFGKVISKVSHCSKKLQQLDSDSSYQRKLQSVSEFVEIFRHLGRKRTCRLEDYATYMTRHRKSCTAEDKGGRFTFKPKFFADLVSDWADIMANVDEKGSRWALKRLQRRYKLFGFKRELWELHMELFNNTAKDNHILFSCSGQIASFGYTSKSALVGDSVALISGVSMPMILREHEGSYKVIGPAFVAIAMNGNVWNLFKEALDHIRLV